MVSIMNKQRRRKLVVTCGLLGLMLLGGAPASTNISNPFVITAQAATTYSDNWKMDEAGNWRYYLNDGGIATDAWVHDHGEWYLLGSDGVMRTGVFKSNDNKYYLLDTVRGTGTYGKLLKNGSVYNGITLSCDTSATYEGALSAGSLLALKNAGVETVNVPDVQNTKHVSNGSVTLDQSSDTEWQQPAGTTPDDYSWGTGDQQTGNNTSSSSSGNTQTEAERQEEAFKQFDEFFGGDHERGTGFDSEGVNWRY